MQIRSELRESAKWTIIAGLVIQSSNLIKMVFLARMLMPEIFGEASILVGIITLTTIICQFGIVQSVIASKITSEYYLSTMINISILIGIFACILLNITSEYLGAYYKSVQIQNEIIIMSVGIMLTQLELVPNGYFQRELRYKSLVYINIVKSIVTCILSLVLAYIGFGVISIIVPPIISSLIALFIYYKKMNIKYYFCISHIDFKSEISFNISGLISGISNYICNNGIVIIMGRYCSINFLGQYSLAQKIADVELYILTAPVHNYLLPILNKVKNESKKLVYAALEISRLQCLFLLPALILLYLNAHFIIQIVFGENWIIASDIFKLILLMQFIKMCMIPANSIIYAARLPEKSALISVVRLAAFIIGFFTIIYLEFIDMDALKIILFIDSFIFFMYVRTAISILNLSMFDYVNYIRGPVFMNFFVVLISIGILSFCDVDDILGANFFASLFLPILLYFLFFIFIYRADVIKMYNFIVGR